MTKTQVIYHSLFFFLFRRILIPRTVPVIEALNSTNMSAADNPRRRSSLRYEGMYGGRTHQIMPPRGRVHPLLLPPRCHPLQHLHILLVQRDHFEVLLDSTWVDGFGQHDAAAVDLVGDEDCGGRDVVFRCDDANFGVGEERGVYKNSKSEKLICQRRRSTYSSSLEGSMPLGECPCLHTTSSVCAGDSTGGARPVDKQNKKTVSCQLYLTCLLQHT